MKQLIATTDILTSYFESFRQHVHLLIAWGYEAAKPRLTMDDEEEINDILYQEIHRVLCSHRERWLSHYAVKNEDPISGGRRIGRKRREIDIVIEFVAVRDRPQYVFEAKPLNYDKSYQRAPNYMGREGMERFLDGEYAEHTAHYPEVGMLGYVLSDDVESWYKILKNAIEAKSVKLRLKALPKDIAVVDDLPMEWISEHERSSSTSPITIYHILLDCCTQIPS